MLYIVLHYLDILSGCLYFLSNRLYIVLSLLKTYYPTHFPSHHDSLPTGTYDLGLESSETYRKTYKLDIRGPLYLFESSWKIREEVEVIFHYERVICLKPFMFFHMFSLHFSKHLSKREETVRWGRAEGHDKGLGVTTLISVRNPYRGSTPHSIQRPIE